MTDIILLKLERIEGMLANMQIEPQKAGIINIHQRQGDQRG